jgi:hypothetical protein
MRKKLLSWIGFILFLISPFIVAGPVDAAYLKFDKTTVSAAANQTFTVSVVVNAGTDQITAADIWVLYDPAFLQAQTVTTGTFFPAVTNNSTSGSVAITALVVDPGTYKTGEGTVATITFSALKNGTTTLSFDCRTDVSNSSKIIQNDMNATNIIVCSQNLSAAVTIGAGGASSSSQSSVYTPSVYPTTPSSLPNTGVAENIAKFAAPGIMLLLIGGMLRFILD